MKNVRPFNPVGREDVATVTRFTVCDNLARNLLPGQDGPSWDSGSRAPEKHSVTARKGLRPSQAGRDDPTPIVELLQLTPLDDLEETVMALKAERKLAEVRQAMVERIARAPLADFDRLKHIYLKHCGSTER